jgi:hypothetical protein
LIVTPEKKKGGLSVVKLKQISVFLENKSGRLSELTRVLGENNINIRALSIADTEDFGILRLIVNDPEKAWQVLKERGFTVSETKIIAVEIPDVPGGLAKVLEILETHAINIEYIYAFVGQRQGNAVVVFWVEDIDSAVKILQDKGFHLLDGEEIG